MGIPLFTGEVAMVGVASIPTKHPPLCDSDIRYQFYNERYIIKEWIQNTEIQFFRTRTQNSKLSLFLPHLIEISMSDVRCQFYRMWYIDATKIEISLYCKINNIII